MLKLKLIIPWALLLIILWISFAIPHYFNWILFSYFDPTTSQLIKSEWFSAPYLITCIVLAMGFLGKALHSYLENLS